MYPNLGEIYSVTVLLIKVIIITNIKLKIVNILVKLLGTLGDLDVRIPLDEGLVRYIGEKIWQNIESTGTRRTF